MSPVRNGFFSIFTPNETAPPTPGPFSSVAFNVSIFWVPRNSHYSSVFDLKRILRYPPSVKSKLILCKNSVHDFIFENTGDSKCYMMVGSIWKNACTVITDCTQSNHREKSFLNQNPIPLSPLLLAISLPSFKQCL